MGLEGFTLLVHIVPEQRRSPLPGPSNLDDPVYASYAWGRYWQIMRLMAKLTFICISVVLGLLFYLHGMVSIHLYIATAAGVGFTFMLTAALMGLVFLSSGSGHDESIDDPVSRTIDPDD